MSPLKAQTNVADFIIWTGSLVTHQCDIGILRVTGIKAEAKWDLTFCALFCDDQCTMTSKGKIDTWPLIVT